MAKNKSVFVTGGTGFIGRSLVRSLLDKGYEPICLVLPGEDLECFSGLDVKTIIGDLSEPDQLPEILPEVQYVFHLAAMLSGGNNPELLKRINVDGSKSLIDHYKKSGKIFKRFVFVSSLAAGGPSGKSGRLNEESESNPESLYGKSKLETEEYLFKLKSEIPFTILRLPLVYGPGTIRGMYLLFKFCDKRIQFKNINTLGNVGYVNDMSTGIIQAAESEIAVGKKYFIGENSVYTTSDIWEKIASIMGKRMIKIKFPYRIMYSSFYLIEKISYIFKFRPPIKSESVRAYYNSNWCVSVDKAEKELNYKTNCPLEQGLIKTADWYKKNR